MVEKIEKLIKELRKFEHIHICQSVSFETTRTQVQHEPSYKYEDEVITHTHLTMFEFVDRRKFEDYKLVLECDYSTDDNEKLLEIVYNKLEELKTLYSSEEKGEE